MRSRLRNQGVYTLSAVDLFASAMGAFIIITIILMPDYQKEVKLEGHLAYLENLAAQTEVLLDETELGQDDTRQALLAAQTRHMELQSEQDIISAEIETINALLTAQADNPPPPPPSTEDTEDDTGSRRVTFRFLGLRTDATRLLILVDMNKYLEQHEELLQQTVFRALESLDEGYQFAVIGFQQMDSGPRFHRWPENNDMAIMSSANRRAARRFVRGLAGEFGGGSPLAAAFQEAFLMPADAIILVSDGLPNPAFNAGLPPTALVQNITLNNMSSAEIHAVTVGDYFKYKGTVEFMETLAKANNGGFLALSQ